MGELVYENENYYIKIATPPRTNEYPEPFPVYCIYNKKYQVLEYYHQVLFYAKQNADLFNDLLVKGEPKTPEFGEMKTTPGWN